MICMGRLLVLGGVQSIIILVRIQISATINDIWLTRLVTMTSLSSYVAVFLKSILYCTVHVQV